MPKHPIQSAELGDVTHHERGPKDLTRLTPPPDAKTGLTPEETIAGLEDASREMRQVSPGVFNHPRRGGYDKCGAKMGRCFGEIRSGKCVACGADYTRTTPLGGVNR
jgi:hypothetical protein